MRERITSFNVGPDYGSHHFQISVTVPIKIKTEKSFFETKLERPSFFKTKKQTSSQLPKVPSPVPSKEIFLTQPEETDSRSTSVMATSLAGPR